MVRVRVSPNPHPNPNAIRSLNPNPVQVYGWECSQESNKIPGAGEELKSGGTLPADNRTWDVASMETSRSLCLTTIREFAEGTQVRVRVRVRIRVRVRVSVRVRVRVRVKVSVRRGARRSIRP